MSGVIVCVIPRAGKSALGDVIVVVVVTRNGGAVDRGRKGKEKQESASNGGEHRAGREGAHKGVITGIGSPYKVTSSWHRQTASALPFICPISPYSLFRLSPVWALRHLYR